MTNCDYTRHQGVKTEKDLSICLQTFRSIPSEDWLKMCNVEGHNLDLQKNPSAKDLRELRLAYYQKE